MLEEVGNLAARVWRGEALQQRRELDKEKGISSETLSGGQGSSGGRDER